MVELEADLAGSVEENQVFARADAGVVEDDRTQNGIGDGVHGYSDVFDCAMHVFVVQIRVGLDDTV